MKEKLKTDPLVTLCSNYLWELNYIERTHRSTQTRSQTHVYFFFFLTPGLVYAVSPPKLKSLIETLPLFTHTHTHTLSDSWLTRCFASLFKDDMKKKLFQHQSSEVHQC